MTQGDRERLLNALLVGVPAEPAGQYRELYELCSRDVDTLEPIIDEIVCRERMAAYKDGLVCKVLSA
jgi:hypothetical protein